jgi:very-short-patch-repair endonuclease
MLCGHYFPVCCIRIVLNRNKGDVLYFDKDSARKRGLVYKGGHMPYNAANVDKAKAMRREMTPEEKKLWFGFLRNFKYRVLRQRPIDHFVVDFYCSKLKLAIEADGTQHQTEKGLRYDKQRSAVLAAYGIQMLRFKNQEIRENFSEVCRKISEFDKNPDSDSPARQM